MRKMDEIYDIVIHHSKSVGGSKSFMYQIAVVDNGYDDISYHFILPNGLPMRNSRGEVTWEAGKDGSVKIGRLMAWQGAHTRGFNKHSIGICLIGNFDETNPTQKQIDSLVSLLTLLCTQYRLTPENIWGHRDKGNSTCPGRNLYSELSVIREMVRFEMNKMNVLSRVKARFGLLGTLGK